MMKQLEIQDQKLRKFNFTVFIRSNDTSKTVSLYGRISYNNERGNPFALGMQVLLKNWNKTEQCITGKQYAGMNERLQKIREDIDLLYSDFERTKQPFTAEDMTKAYTQKDEPLPSLIDVYRLFIDFKEQQATANLIKWSTINRHTWFKNNILAFLETKKQANLKIADFAIKDMDNFVHYSQTVKKHKPRYVKKQVDTLKELFKWAYNQEFITHNPIQHYKLDRIKPTDKEFLELHELEQLIAFQPHTEVLEKAKDWFVFQCFTGFAWIDMKNFDYQKHTYFNLAANKLYINKPRQKTGIVAHLPLFPKAAEILLKYNYTFKNAKLAYGRYNNEYIKELGKLLGFTKVLTTHVGRRTFGCVCLNENMSIETVSKMLGHSSIAETQKTYAKILAKRIENDTKDFYDKKF
jgi:integrase